MNIDDVLYEIGTHLGYKHLLEWYLINYRKINESNRHRFKQLLHDKYEEALNILIDRLLRIIHIAGFEWNDPIEGLQFMQYSSFYSSYDQPYPYAFNYTFIPLDEVEDILRDSIIKNTVFMIRINNIIDSDEDYYDRPFFLRHAHDVDKNDEWKYITFKFDSKSALDELLA